MATQELTFKINATAAQASAEIKKFASDVTNSQKAIGQGELTLSQQLKAAESLQRQRSAALIAEWKKQEAAAKKAAQGSSEFTNTLKQLAASVGVLQGPLNGISGRITAFSTLAKTAGDELGTMGTEAEAAATGLGAMAAPIAVVVAAVAGMTAGILLLIKTTIDVTKATAEWQGALFDTSQQLGISTETLSAFEILAKTTGSDLGSITASLGIFQKKLEEGQDPMSKTAQLFKELGVNATNTEDSLRQTLTALSRMPEGFHQTATALELFGRGGKSILAILKEMDGDLDGAIKKFRQMGLVVSQEDAKAADEFNDQLAIIDFQFRALTAQIAEKAIPTMLAALKRFSEVLDNNKETVQALGIAIDFIAHAFVGAVEVINGAIKIASPVLEGYVKLYQLLTQTVQEAASATTLAANAITAATAATAALPGTGEFGGGEAGVRATAIHQPKGEKPEKAKAEKKTEEQREAERALKARTDLVKDLTGELNKQLAIEAGIDVTTRAYAVSQQLLNDQLATASDEFKRMRIGQAEDIDKITKKNKATAEYTAFLKSQNEAIKEVTEGVKGHLEITEELIDHLQAEGVILNGMERHWLRMGAAILSSVDALKMYAATLEPILLAGVPGPGLGDDAIAAQAGAAANAATEAEAAAADAAADAQARHAESLRILKDTAMDTFASLAQGIGGLIQNWVLLGNLGPQGLRKMVAAILAAAAAQAAVEAIMELAYAAKEFALAAADAAILNVAGAALHTASAHGHLTSAAIFGGIAVGAAIGGRFIAGGAFQNASGGGGGGGGRSSAGTSAANGKPSTTEANRLNYNAPRRDTLEIVFKGELGDVIEHRWINKYTEGGRMRNLVLNDRDG